MNDLTELLFVQTVLSFSDLLHLRLISDQTTFVVWDQYFLC